MGGLVRKEQGKEFDWLHRKVKFKKCSRWLCESSKIPDLLTPRRICHAYTHTLNSYPLSGFPSMRTRLVSLRFSFSLKTTLFLVACRCKVKECLSSNAAAVSPARDSWAARSRTSVADAL